EIGLVGAADEDLAAVDHPVITVAYRTGADRTRRITAAGGLGQAEEALLLTAQHRVEIALLLLLGGLEELRQPGTAEHAVTGRVEAGAVLGHLDREQRPGDQVELGAPVLGRDIETVQAHGLGLFD